MRLTSSSRCIRNSSKDGGEIARRSEEEFSIIFNRYSSFATLHILTFKNYRTLHPYLLCFPLYKTHGSMTMLISFDECSGPQLKSPECLEYSSASHLLNALSIPHRPQPLDHQPLAHDQPKIPEGGPSSSSGPLPSGGTGGGKGIPKTCSAGTSSPDSGLCAECAPARLLTWRVISHSAKPAPVMSRAWKKARRITATSIPSNTISNAR